MSLSVTEVCVLLYRLLCYYQLIEVVFCCSAIVMNVVLKESKHCKLEHRSNLRSKIVCFDQMNELL